ncbi:unnamed protein product [Paramecium sonneborni]|uniref:RING-type domain-containing protein n=1 Tax=Paramecium sonneborni TaxID=65129 RepID=A0A8S1Q2L8_9CILI|nr:unnamed protein product [Paramecium sonneborni]
MGKQILQEQQALKNPSLRKKSKIRKEQQNNKSDLNRYFEKSEPNLECIICYSPILDQGIIESCQHKFCFQCINIWAKQSLSCPQCRAGFTKINRIWKKESIEKQKTYTFIDPKKTDEMSHHLRFTQLLSSLFFLALFMGSEDEQD